MSLFNTKTITVHRYDNGDYETPDGSWREGNESSDSPFTIKCSWQLQTGEQLEALPEGQRSDSVFKIYTSTKLRTVQQKNQLPPDILISPLDGEEYEVNESGNFQNGIISHYRYLATSKKEEIHDYNRFS